MGKSFNLFVYGTLMSGREAHSFIPDNAKMSLGKISGNLYHYSAGYPIADIVKHKYSVLGSSDYNNDVALQDKLNQIKDGVLPKKEGYGSVYGELYEIPFIDDEDLSEIVWAFDQYEGYSPFSKYNLYTRVNIPVETESGVVWAWVYNMDNLPGGLVYIPSGNWRDCFSRDGVMMDDIRVRAIKNMCVLHPDMDGI